MKSLYTLLFALIALSSFGQTSNSANNNGNSSNNNTGNNNGNNNSNYNNSSAIVAPGDPSVFGNGFWYAYCHNGLLVPNSTKPAAYYGYYTENNLSFYSSSRWAETSLPTKANNLSGNKYVGNTALDTVHTVSYKRTGFTYGSYQINIPWHDNDAYLFINGKQVWNHTGCCQAFYNVWSGILDQNTTVEFKWVNFEKGSSGAMQVLPIGALPINLVNFTATKQANDVQLKWTTATEINNDFFTVEKSTDGTHFEAIATVKGAGNSNITRSYSAIDENISTGKSYYRIKQTDFNGQSSYSVVTCVNYNTDSGFTVCPNPGNSGESMYVSIPSENNQQVLIVVRDVQGQEYYSKVVLDTESHQLVALNPEPALPSGMYIVVASSNNNVYSQKIIVR